MEILHDKNQSAEGEHQHTGVPVHSVLGESDDDIQNIGGDDDTEGCEEVDDVLNADEVVDYHELASLYGIEVG